MEEPKERELIIYGECPKCKNLVKIEIRLKTALAKEEQEEKPEEEKPNAGQEKPKQAKAEDKGASVRPNSQEGAAANAGEAAKPSDSKTSAGAKQARGK